MRGDMGQDTEKRRKQEKILASVKDLSIEFTDRGIYEEVVKKISFPIYEGEILGVVGESGSGKSMSALSIMGLLPDSAQVKSGSIEFCKKDGNIVDLLQLSGQEREKIQGEEIAMVFQEPMTSLNPVMKIGKQVGENLALHTDLSKEEIHEKCVKALQAVGLSEAEALLERYPHELSGGMRQRVMIAMALACNPKLLIADEPTTALDVTIQAQILDLLRRLRDDTGMAVLLITHDLGVVSETADRVVVMYCGQVVEEAEVRTLFDHPMHPYTLGLLKSIPRLEDDDSKRLYMIKGMVPNPLEMPPGCHFSDRCDSCMDICRTKVPELVDVDGHKVRCFLYESADGEVKSEEAIARAEAEALADVEAAREVETAEALLAAEDLREAEIEEIEKEEEASR